MSGGFAATAATLGLQVLQRDWLSANQTVFAACGRPCTVVDTGHARHAEHTLALLDHALGGAALQQVLNTHLHSDHCGGNAALQARWRVQTRVPAASHAAVAQWDEDRLSYRPSGQHCPRFAVDGVLVPGSQVRLGPTDWQVLAAPGHDPDAILLFEPQTRTLIAGDALWQNRLAVIFPELVEASGFAETRATLDLIERLAPRWVIPGHGEPFEDVAEALAGSRSRLSAFEADPRRHARHAARALLMFHLMELGGSDAGALQRWIVHTPLFVAMARQLGASDLDRWATGLIDSLVGDGLVRRENARLQLVPSH
jgi:glyoxylase-like metal-dependent hydrolase (beta-lactamase superfamily II)